MNKLSPQTRTHPIMEVFNMDQDQLNSNVNVKVNYAPSSSSSPSSPSSPSTTSITRACNQQARDICENCRRGGSSSSSSHSSSQSFHSVNNNNNNNNNNNDEGVDEDQQVVDPDASSSFYPVSTSGKLQRQRGCTCRQTLSSPQSPPTATDDTTTTHNPNPSTSCSTNSSNNSTTATVAATTGDRDSSSSSVDRVRDNDTRASPSPDVMSLSTTPVGIVSAPTLTPTPAPIPNHFHDTSAQDILTSSGFGSTTSTCPHLLNSPEGLISPLRHNVIDNLNRHTHYCHACGSLPPAHSVPLPSSENDMTSSSHAGSFPMPSSSPNSSSSFSSGPIPIPSRTNKRHRQNHQQHQHQHNHQHHHHQFSSSLSTPYQGFAEDSAHISSSPSAPTVFPSLLSSSSSTWKFQDLSSGATTTTTTPGYCSSEPGHLAFFPQQSPKYFKQPSSSQDHALKYPGSDKPSAIDQWPRSAAGSRRAPVPSSLSTSSQLTSAESSSASTSSSSPKTSSKSKTELSAFSRRPRIGGVLSVPGDGQGVPGSRASNNSSSGRVATRITLRSRSHRREVEVEKEQQQQQGFDVDDEGEYARRLPHHLLDQLHQFEHQNEDLSADVVFALEDKGYNIHQVLGKGISSTVRRVTEKQTGREYAVKIIDISGERCESAAIVEQTRKDTFREIFILRMCGGHPNIIELHDVFETPTFIFLVFEICKQGELFDYLTSVVSLSEKKTRFFMRQLLEAVNFCHAKNIVHRDLKPENILLDDDLNIKVSDYGFATVVEQNEELSELCGTPGYLAPEVLAHSMYENVPGYGKEVDMWACGVIMYTLLCGAPPFWNRRQMMMLRAIMNADYTFNSPEWDDISDAPKNLIQKLLVLNPKERLTAREALQHPFFHNKDIKDHKKFNARRKFRAGVFCVLFYTRLNFFYTHPAPIAVKTVTTNPYSIKIMRKIIDSCAFGMYRHWVKRVDNQNRAALFEHTLREDWKHGLISNIGQETH